MSCSGGSRSGASSSHRRPDPTGIRSGPTADGELGSARAGLVAVPCGPAARVFPLVPKYRVTGLAARRRPQPAPRATAPTSPGRALTCRGDPISTIDWRASARLSTARARDEFVVRERYAEEAPRVVILCDRRPSMGLYESRRSHGSRSRAAVRSVDRVDRRRAREARNAAVAYLDYAGSDGRGGEPYWLAPTGRSALARIDDAARRAERLRRARRRPRRAASSSSPGSGASSRRARSSSCLRLPRRARFRPRPG